MNGKLSSDEIRERERRRRRKGLWWNAVSFTLHCAVFAAIILLTPVKSAVFKPKKEKANPAADLSADRIEQIADSLSRARINELLRQLEALQAVLHNMDLIKEELQRDYDGFAASSSADMKAELEKILDEAEAAQKRAVGEQNPLIGMVEKMVAEEKLDLADEARSKYLRDSSMQLIASAGDKVNEAQAIAGNALDRVQVQAEFAGYRKTAEASGKVRDAQIEAASMQNQAQKESSEIAGKLGRYRGDLLTYHNRTNRLAEIRRALVKAEEAQSTAKVNLPEAVKLRDAAEKARDEAVEREKEQRSLADKADAEAKKAREESARLRKELADAKRRLDKARRERDAVRCKAAQKKGGGR